MGLQVYIGLWRLSHSESLANLGERFGVGAETARRAIYDFCAAMVAEFFDEYVKLPSLEQVERVMAAFASWCGLPNIVGAVDGTHFPICKPSLTPEEARRYFCRKGPLWS